MKSDVKKIHKQGGTSRSLKRGVSLLLSLLMLVGIFTALPLNVGAVEKENTTTVSETEQSAAEKQVNETKKPVVKEKAKVKNGAKANEMQTGEGETSGNCGDDLNWSYDSVTTTLTINGTGEMYNYTSTSSPWNDYKSQITDIVIESGVTSIGNYAFYKCTTLTNVTIPDSVTYIGNEAFGYDMNLLTRPYYSSNCILGSYVFSNCGFASGSIGSSITWSLDSKILTISGYGEIPQSKSTSQNPWYNYKDIVENVVIENGITVVNTSTIEILTAVKTITLPPSITKLFCNFGFLNSLNGIYISDLASWCNITFKNNIYNPLSKAKNLYLNNELVTHLTIPNNVTSIGDYAFYGCTSITDITIPNNVTSIGDYAFYGCTSITDITIPNSVTRIGKRAFNNTSYYNNSENWDDNVLYIGNFLINVSYQGFTNSSYTVKNNTTVIGDYAFDTSTHNLESVNFPDSITHIGEYAFANHKKIISKPSIPNGCIIASTAFVGCGFGEGTCGTNLIWELSNGTLTISGTGTMNDYTDGKSPWSSYRSQIKTVLIENGATSIGNYAFGGCTGLTSITIPNSVTSIGNYAFGSCTGLTSITIPNSVTSIGNYAFGSCTGLTSITIPNSVTSIGNNAFYKCTKLTSITIPSSVTSIGDYAFENCSSLTSITIPNNVTSINTGVFYNCTKLESVTIPDSVTSIGINAFNGCSSLISVTIPDSVTSIGSYAFNVCAGLTTVTISNNSSLSSVGNCAFKNCTNLMTKPYIPTNCTVSSTAFEGCGFVYYQLGDNVTCSLDNGVLTISGTGDMYSSGQAVCISENKDSITSIIIGNGVTSIGNSAFKNCSSLTNVTIPSSVTSIDTDAFRFCSSLTSVTIPSSVTSIGECSFGGCTSLCNINIPQNASSMNCTIDRTAFSGVMLCGPANSKLSAVWYKENGVLHYKGNGTIRKTGYNDIVNSSPDLNVANIIIENGINVIGESVFQNYTNLQNITIPSSVTKIELSAFKGCSKLNNITIPNSVTEIGAYAFDYCSSISNITLPNSITSIRNNAFRGCSALTNISIPNNVTTIDAYTFSECSNLRTITIPESVTRINRAAFAYCNNATVVLPDTITSLGGYDFYLVNRVTVPVDSYVYNCLTSQNFTEYRCARTEVIGIVSNDQQFASVFSSGTSGKGGLSTSAKAKLPTRAKIKKSTTGLEPVEEQLTEEEIAENLSHIRCYLVDDVKVDESVTFDSENDVVFHLNNFTVNSNGDLVDGAPHTLEGSTSDTFIEVPGNLTIKTTGEGQGGIINTSGDLFNVESGGSLTIENGVYSEDVSEYIADNKVIGKTGNRYTVFNNKTEDLTPENDNHTFTLDNSIEAFERQQLLGVQIRPETDTISQAMRFVSVVRSDLLRGAKDYGFVLAKGKNVENMRTNKNNILADSAQCLKVSAKGSSNTLADEAYSSNDLNEGKYKYLTAAITDIDDDNAAIGARLYIERQDGTFVYADYTCVSTMGEIKAMAA